MYWYLLEISRLRDGLVIGMFRFRNDSVVFSVIVCVICSVFMMISGGR